MQYNQQKYQNEHLKLMLKNKVDIVEAEKSIKRKYRAEALIAGLKKQKSDWYYKKTIESLYTFLDLEFVRKP